MHSQDNNSSLSLEITLFERYLSKQFIPAYATQGLLPLSRQIQRSGRRGLSYSQHPHICVLPIPTKRLAVLYSQSIRWIWQVGGLNIVELVYRAQQRGRLRWIEEKNAGWAGFFLFVSQMFRAVQRGFHAADTLQNTIRKKGKKARSEEKGKMVGDLSTCVVYPLRSGGCQGMWEAAFTAPNKKLTYYTLE